MAGRMRGARWAATAALGLLAGACGALSPGDPCPMWRGAPTVSVDATPYVAAHRGRVAGLGVCVLGRRTRCGVAAAARRRVAVDPGPPVFVLGPLGKGTYRVRVVLDDAVGHVVFTATGVLKVHHTDGGRCHNLVGDHGRSLLDARGRIVPD